MEEEKKKEKTIFDLGLHETLIIVEKLSIKDSSGSPILKKYEVTKVPNGFVYAFEYVGFRQVPIVFVPFKEEGTK